ncbi:MAG: tRNA modification GTPase MnmE [Candidatus Babeliales bacterium]
MFHSVDEQTIIAQCTPRGSGAIALLRISGTDAILIADAIARLASGKKLAALTSHTIHYGSIMDQNGNRVDSVLFLLMHGPRTFTGQDTVEITCHNNPFIIEEIISLAICAGARLAQEGEFTKRAVINGKIDLVQAEAINELIHAQTQMALKQSLAQLSGSFSSWLAGIELELMKALAFCQASFEFLDEEIELGVQISTMITGIKQSIAEIKKTFNQQQQIRQGVRIALIGSVNAGKSSLFNALLNQQRAIVNAQAGTTRDSIEAGLYKNGNFWTLVDTAGLRQTQDIIEQEGIRRSFEEAHKADIILLAHDSTRELNEEEKSVYTQLQEKYASKIILVMTKCDHLVSPTLKLRRTETPLNEKQLPSAETLCEGWEQNSLVRRSLSEDGSRTIHVSSKTKNNIDTLEQLIQQKITSLFADIASPFLLNQRQYNLLLALENKLNDIQTMLRSQQIAYELLSIHLNDAIAHLAELSGKEISETSMDMVFREFCVGK